MHVVLLSEGFLSEISHSIKKLNTSPFLVYSLNIHIHCTQVDKANPNKFWLVNLFSSLCRRQDRKDIKLYTEYPKLARNPFILLCFILTFDAFTVRQNGKT